MSAVRLALVTLLTTPLLQAQNSPPDGLILLRQMSQQYASATSWYIEATEEHTIENEHCSKSREIKIIGAESGKSYHYESLSPDPALRVSDRTTTWDFHPDANEYRKQPAPADGYKPGNGSDAAEDEILEAMNLRNDFANLAGLYNAATRMPDEVLHDTGLDIPCYVVQVTTADRKGSKSPGESITNKLWIDRKTGVVWRRAQHRDTVTNIGSTQIPITIDSVTRYSTVLLIAPIPEALFHFDPPANAKSVVRFNVHHLGPDMTGETAPDVQLVAADGASAPLSSYRGKPVLLDFWATWCKFCIENLPKLAELAKEAAPKGLVLLSVDEDSDEQKATDFLAEHHYTWPNTHDDFSILDVFNRGGIPLAVLIDAQGTIVYYGSGEDDGLSAAIAALGPQYASLAPAPKPEAACEIASKQPPIN